MSLRLYGTISGWGRSAGTVIPALGAGRYAPGPNIGLPSWLQGSDPHCTLNVFWGQPGALATVSLYLSFRRCTQEVFLHRPSVARMVCVRVAVRDNFRNPFAGRTHSFYGLEHGETVDL